MRTCLLVLSIVCLSSGLAARADEKPKDAPKLEGTTWTATLWKRGPGEIGKDKVATELKFTKDGYEFPKGINRISKAGTYSVDAARGTIDFVPEDGPARGKTLVGIYKVEGDTLTLCFTGAGGERPKEFKSGDRNTVLATYERKK